MSRKISYYVILIKHPKRSIPFFLSDENGEKTITEKYEEDIRFTTHTEPKKLIKKLKLNRSGVNCDVYSDLDISIAGLQKNINQSNKDHCIVDDSSNEFITFNEETKEYEFTTNHNNATLWSKEDAELFIKSNVSILFPNKNVSVRLFNIELKETIDN